MTHPFVANINQKNAETFIETFPEKSCAFEETKQIVQIFKEAKKCDWKIGFSEARDKKNFEVLFEDVIELNDFLNEMSFFKKSEDSAPEEFEPSANRDPESDLMIVSEDSNKLPPLPKAIVSEDPKPEAIVKEFPQKVQYKLDFGGGWENFKVRIFAFLSWIGMGSFQIRIAEKVDGLVKDLLREIDKEFGNLNERRALQAMEAKNIVRDIRVESPREKKNLVALMTAAVIHRDDQEITLEA